MKLLTKTPKLAWLILLLLPFAACLALPLALLSGDLKQAGKCGTCRLVAAVTKNNDIKFC